MRLAQVQTAQQGLRDVYLQRHMQLLSAECCSHVLQALAPSGPERGACARGVLASVNVHSMRCTERARPTPQTGLQCCGVRLRVTLVDAVRKRVGL
jgi:hypothetical protein